MDMGMKYSIWTSAYKAYLGKDYDTALKIYSTIDHLPQALFNMASICIVMGNYDKAIDYLTNAIAIDKKFAIGYYQRGFCYFSSKKYQTAASDFSSARKLLKAKKVVDYLPAGLDAKLYMCELLYNSSRCYAKLEIPVKADILISLATKFVITDSQKLMVNSSAQDICFVEAGLQFIPELKLKTLGTNENREVFRNIPVRNQTLNKVINHARSFSEDLPPKKNLRQQDIDPTKSLRSKSMILDHLFSGKFSTQYEADPGETSPTAKRESIFKILSPEGNLMIALDSNSGLNDLKEKVSLKLRNIGASHYDDLLFLKNGSVLKTDSDLLDSLMPENVLHLKIQKDVVDLYLDF